MVLSKLQKNAIIMGPIDSYCLVCEKYFRSEEDTVTHIEEDGHGKQLLGHAYLQKYSKEHIRKVNKGYFCEFCSLLLPTVAKVSLHIQEKNHYDNKGNCLLRRSEEAVIAFEDVLIGERAWHGLAEECCAICNEEVADEQRHKAEPAHLLALVRSKLEFGANNSLYRKTDDTSIQCLTCNTVLALDKINEHFEGTEHKSKYGKCQEAVKKHMKSQKDKKIEKDPNIVSVKNSSAENVKQDAGSVKTNGVKVVAKNAETKEFHEETTYANQNKITFNAGNNNAYCRVCEIKLPANLRNMKEHVNGKDHKAKLSNITPIPKAKPLFTKSPMKTFIDKFVTVENAFFYDVVVNEKYCMPVLNFLMITKNGEMFRCQTCEMSFHADNINMHRKSAKHERALEETPVVTSLDDEDEFVREVRAGVFHCGYCNQVVPRWEQVAAHVQSGAHREYRGECAWRLQLHLPAIIQHRRHREMTFMQMLAMAAAFRN